MRQLNLQQIHEALGDLKISAQIISSPVQVFSGIATDTRISMQGQLFIALVGEMFDAHDFIEKAISQGAVGVIGHRFQPEVISKYSNQVTFVFVSDTLLALQSLATWSRRQFKGQVIGITGSNGKTTTKEFAASVLSTRFNVFYSKGSFNNHWGVPFSLLQIPDHADFAVIEMGMNHGGEITRLVQIAEPDIVMCTMVGRAHIEHFGTIDKIAEAKSEIYEAARPSSIFGFNLDNPWTEKMFRKYSSKAKLVKTFSSEKPDAHVCLKLKSMNLTSLEIEGSIEGVAGEVRVPVFGEQNIVNLMSAAVLGLCAGLKPEDVWNGLAKCQTIWGRNQVVQTQCGAQALFDAYNANPDSMKALLFNVQKMQCDGKKIGVFAEMLEMGEHAAELHFELGALVARAGFKNVYFVGPSFKHFAAGLESQNYHGNQMTLASQSVELIEDLKRTLQNHDFIVFKGSRGMHLEKVLKALSPLDWIEKN